jgi:hypothetical protein
VLQADRISRYELRGVAQPRLAPPEPIRSLHREYEAEAQALGISLYPWQKIAARYITGLVERPRGRPKKDDVDAWMFKEVCIVVARQNGKTETLMPRILMGLKAGETILHTAQNRRLPRKTFLRLAGMIAAHPDLDYNIRKANGQEEITTPGGGRYALLAPNESARGESADLVLIDEVREQHDQDLMDAMLPTILARKNAQIIYLSNAGDGGSVVLNDLRRRGSENEPGLAYLEWSSAPDRSLDDRDGWAEANPALGHGQLTMSNLEYFRNNRPPTSFETENLCRWVVSMQPKLVDENAWESCRVSALAEALRPFMAIEMDSTGTRASAAIAWRQSDGTIGLRVDADVTGSPIDTDVLGEALRQRALRLGVPTLGYSSPNTTELSRYFKNSKTVDGKEFCSATENFVRLVNLGAIQWDEGEQISDDLTWTARKTLDSGAYQAVKAKEDRPITSVLAAIRAVWLASGPKPVPPKVM